MKSHRILATIGPASLNEDFFRLADSCLVSLYRINLSHTPQAEIESTITKIREFTSTPICLDSEGAQIRNQVMKGGKVFMSEGEEVNIHSNCTIGDENNISFSPPGIVDKFSVGDLIKVDFDQVSMRVTKKNSYGCTAIVVSSGYVGSNKASDINRKIDLAPVSEKDIYAFEVGKDLNVQNYALSFAGSGHNVETVRKLIAGGSNLISKIESKKGLVNLDDIMAASDEILIDRGDLSREVDLDRVPFFQRAIIDKAKKNACPVNVATNLMESMINSPLPTRAELNDVVSTLEMGASGIVLAAETAIGKYPGRAVEFVRKTIENFHKFGGPHDQADQIKKLLEP